MAYKITNLDVADHSKRTGHADTLEAAFECAAGLAITFTCDVLIEDEDPETPGKIAKIVWIDDEDPG